MLDMTDLASHRIEGYAQAALDNGSCDDDAFFSVPLISHIEGNLWMGGCNNKVRLDASFAHVISLYPWEKYTLGDQTTRAEFRLFDSEDIASPAVLDDISEYVNECLKDGKTLVHCQAGLNRSGLISGLSLIKRGWTPPDAINLLRDKRHSIVLCNETFEEYLRNLA